MVIAVLVSVVVFLILEMAVPIFASGVAIGMGGNAVLVRSEAQFLVFGAYVIAALTAISWKLSDLIDRKEASRRD